MGIALAVLGTLLVCVWLCRNTVTARRLVAKTTSIVISDAIPGTLEVIAVERIEFDRLSGVTARLIDQHGRRILEVDGLAIRRPSWGALLRALTDESGGTPFIVPELSVARVDVSCPPSELLHDVIRDAVSTGEGVQRPLWLDRVAISMVTVSLPGSPLNRVALHGVAAEAFFQADVDLGLRVERASLTTASDSVEVRSLYVQVDGPSRTAFSGEARHSLGWVRAEGKIEGDDVAIQASAASVTRNASADLAFIGRLPDLAGEARLQLGKRLVVLRDLENIEISPNFREGSATVPVAMLVEGSTTEVEADLTVRFRLDPPLVEVDARLRKVDFGGVRHQARSGGGPLATVSWAPAEPIALSVRADHFALSNVRIPGLDLDGRVAIHATGALQGDAFEVDLAGAVADLTAGGATVRDLQVRARASGDLGHLLDARIVGLVEGDDARASSFQVSRFSVKVDGPAHNPEVAVDVEQRRKSWTGKARVALGSGRLELQQAAAALRSPSGVLRARARRVVISPERITGEGLELLAGSSRLHGSVEHAPNQSRVVIHGDLDLDILAKVLDLPRTVRGRLAIEKRLELGPSGGEGAFRYSLDPTTENDGLGIDATVRIAGRSVEGQANVTCADLGALGTAQLQLSGPPTALDAWLYPQEFVASIDSTTELRIPYGAERHLVLGAGKAHVLARMTADRERRGFGALKVAARVDDFEMPEELHAVAPSLRNLGAVATFELSGRTKGFAALVELQSGTSTLVRVSATSDHTLDRLLTDLQAVQDLPFQANVEVLPMDVEINGLRGRASGKARVLGPLKQLAWRGMGSVLGVRTEQVAGQRVDVETRFRGDRAAVSAEVTLLEDRRKVADARLSLSRQAGGQLDATTRLLRFPARLLGTWTRTQLEGEISGEVAVRHTVSALTGRLALKARRLALDGVALPSLSLQASLERSAVSGKVTSVGQDGSRLSASARVERTEGAAGLGVDWTSPMSVALNAKRFSLGPWATVVSGNPGAGRLDADVRGTIGFLSDRGCMRLRTALDGRLDLRSAQLRIPAMGLRTEGLNARVLASSGRGKQSFAIDAQSGFAEGGGMKSRGSVELTGGHADAARGRILVDLEDVPVKWQGATFGRLDATVAATLTERRSLRVVVGPALFKLRGKLRTEVVAPDNPKSIVVVDDGVQRPVPEPEPTTCESENAWRGELIVKGMKVTSGGFLESFFADQSVDADIGGRAQFELASSPSVKTRLRIDRGSHADIGGKVFTVEQGAIHLTHAGGVQQLYMVTTARWRARDMTHVYADVSYGPKTTGQGWERREGLSYDVRSVPPRTRREVLDILVSGRPRNAAGSSISVMRGHNRIAFEALYSDGKIANGEPADPLNVASEVDLTRDTSLRYQLGTRGGNRFDIVWQFRY